MRVPMEDREGTDERNCRHRRQGDPERHGRAKHQHRERDGELDEGQGDAADPDRAAYRHHRDESRRNEIQGSAAQRSGIEADRDHGQDVVEPAERVAEAVLEPARGANAGMGLGGGGKKDERCNDEW